MAIELPLSELHYGHEADPPVNVRVKGRDQDVAGLAASIGAHGLIQALSVTQIGGHWYVADGNRRLAALKLLAEQGTLPADSTVKCDPLVDSQVADEISLAANFERLALHEADQYVKFVELAERGMPENEIASRFGIDPARVRRFLALGRLSPKIIDWWREQEQTHETVSIVRAFTLAPSPEEQERVFDRLGNSGNLYAFEIRRQFGADNRDASRFLKYVGAKAYSEAGGAVVEDLFGDNSAVSDPALVAKLADEKLREKVAELVADGWSWAAISEDLPPGWNWNWQKLNLSKKSAKPDQKAMSGAVVSIDREGKLDVVYGVVKPTSGKAAKEGAVKRSDDALPKPATISNALSERLSQQATLALREALRQNGRVGLAALLAGFAIRGTDDTPIKVKHEGYGRPAYVRLDDAETFTDAFKRFVGMSDEELFAAAAGVAAEAVDLTAYVERYRGFRSHARVVADALKGSDVYVAQCGNCQFEDYFASAPKAVILKAITEALNADEARKAASLKKGELVAFALANVPLTGWLPPELRTNCYPKGDIDEVGEIRKEAAE